MAFDLSGIGTNAYGDFLGKYKAIEGDEDAEEENKMEENYDFPSVKSIYEKNF